MDWFDIESLNKLAYMDEYAPGRAISLRKNDGNNHTIKTEGFTEDENKNHSDEDLFLLSICSHTGITYDSNTETGSLYNNSLTLGHLRVMKDRNRVQRRGAYIQACRYSLQ